MNKLQITAVIITAVSVVSLGILCFWQLNKSNERLAMLREQIANIELISQTAATAQQPVIPELIPDREPPRTVEIIPADPEDYLTRAMFTAMLAKTDGADLSEYDYSSFTDVLSSAWYAGAVEWAVDNGVVNGVGDEKFEPYSTITREQTAVMICNYLRYRGFYVPVIKRTFYDRIAVSTWASDAVYIMRDTGIIPDRINGVFDPRGKITNKEADEIFDRLLLLFLQDAPVELPGKQDLDDYGEWLPPFERPEPEPLPVYRNESVEIQY